MKFKDCLDLRGYHVISRVYSVSGNRLLEIELLNSDGHRLAVNMQDLERELALLRTVDGGNGEAVIPLITHRMRIIRQAKIDRALSTDGGFDSLTIAAERYRPVLC